MRAKETAGMDRNAAETREGNSGEWFLEAVGKSIEPPPPPTVLKPETTPQAEAPAGVDATPNGAAADGTDAASAPDSTTELVGQMWRATGTQDPLEDWEPADLDRYVSRKRNFRWSVWIMALLVIGAVVAAVLLSPRLVERQAATEAAEYAVVLADLRTILPATQQVLATLTEPDTPTDQLADLVPDLSRLQAAADAVIEASTRELPKPLPLIPSDALDDLEPSRDTMARLGSEATALATQLSDGIAYRSFTEGFLDPGELPTTADSLEISSIQERLATGLAEATGVLARLPGDPIFTDHSALLSSAIGTYRDWEPAYLAALRNGDAAEAERLIGAHQELLASLARDVVPALAALRTELDAIILDLDRELVDTINGLPG